MAGADDMVCSAFRGDEDDGAVAAETVWWANSGRPEVGCC